MTERMTDRMTERITLVLFDMEGVLSHYDRSARVDALATICGQTPDTVRYAIWGSGLEARADSGEIGDDEYLSELAALLNYPVTRDEWLLARRASITPNDAVIGLAAHVAKQCRIAVLTNNCRLMTEHLARLNPPVARLFGSQVYASALFGAAKPDARAYLGCLAHLNVPPAQALFIDDTQANVDGAVRAGLHGFRFEGADGLSAELDRFGLI